MWRSGQHAGMLLCDVNCVNMKWVSGNSVGRQQGNIGTDELRTKSKNTEKVGTRADVGPRLSREVTRNCEVKLPRLA